MKNIQLINPKQASELLQPWDYSFIQVLTKVKPIILAKPNSFNVEKINGLQIEIKIGPAGGTAYKIDLASYPDDVILELRDLEWGLLLLINNTEYLLISSSLIDLSPLAGLTNLITLDLTDSFSLIDLSPLAGLTNLSTLNLDSCTSLSDLSPLAGLTNLSSLNLRNGFKLIDLSPITGLTNLSDLNLDSCTSHIDLSPLADLTKLSDLNLIGTRGDLRHLANLSNLINLNLCYCSSLSDLSPLAGLTNLITLDFFSCSSLSDLSPLAGLKNLSYLSLSSCDSLSDLSPLAGLTNLTTLDLCVCDSLSDLSPLAGLTNLSSLYLSSCKSLIDLSPLSDLTNLTSLDLSSCKSLIDLSPLSDLTNLTSLDLSSCDSLIFVKHLAKLKNLFDLNLKTSGNIRDFEELINCPNLKKVEWTEKPICSYVLAGSAIKRKDFDFIEKNINDWIQDIKFSKNPIAFANEIIAASVLIKFKDQATTHLINAASQIRARGLADGEKGNAISAYVWELWADAALQLGAENFTACFESALANLNTEREIEVLLSPILTNLADVPIQYPSAKTWALNLVSQTLLPISVQEDAARMAAPAAAVFYAGMQMPEEVLLWLKRGTHPNIPRWKDTVLLALVNYYAPKNNFVKAREYTSQIDLPDVKDQARILLAEAMAGTMPNEALEEFASISDLLQQLALAKKLMLEPNITNNSKGIYQLLLCLEQSPTDLGNFIKTLLSQNPESKLVSAIEALFAKEPQVASTSATALLTICANPSISDFISPRVLERLKQELEETAANERLYLIKELTAQLVEKKLLPAADEKDFLDALNN